MQRAATFFGSSIGKKVVMAATGLVLYGFVIGHMVGNLQIYLGPKAINDYAEFLQHFLHGQGIWLARGSLLVAVGLHIWAAVTLTLSNWSARPVGYRDWQARESTYASRTMVWSGPILAAFIVYHLAHFTVGSVHPEFVKGEVYRNVVVGFQNPFASAFYVLAMCALGPAHVPRLLEHAADPRPEPPALEPAAAHGVARAGRDRGARQRLDPAGRAHRPRPPVGGSPWNSRPTSPRARSPRSGRSTAST